MHGMAEVCAGQNLGADGFGLTRVIHANKDLVLRIPFTPFIPVKPGFCNRAVLPDSDASPEW
jgi:hypothetical protein